MPTSAKIRRNAALHLVSRSQTKIRRPQSTPSSLLHKTVCNHLNGYDSLMTTPLENLKAEIKQSIVRSLRLPITPAEIGDAAPLFGDGLGLDSIDVLELVLELERSFGVSIGDEQTGMTVLRSVDTIADFIVNERAKKSA